MVEETQRRTYDLLHRMPSEGVRAVKELFCTELNYDRAGLTLSTRGWPEQAKDALADPPTILARHESQFRDSRSFDIIHATLSPEWQGRGFPLSLTAERLVINQLLENHPYALFVFSDTEEQYWHLVNVRYDDESSRRRVFRRISVGPDEQLRTASERVAMLDVRELSPGLFGVHPLELQRRHDEAFDVEKVTRQFFQQYQQVFNVLQNDLKSQIDDSVWAHDFALQFLNRLMFLYYVQRKRWLGNDPDFLEHFWQTYRTADRPKDTFVEEWLSVLFFEAFNNRFQDGESDRKQFPEEMRSALATAPFLNGGLFEENELDQTHSPRITDRRFEEVLDFLEGYNFTISEDTPLDQEVAVDPEMIGKVYESLVNVSEEADERGEAGIFYTPRVEIDLMCRLSLVDWLTNHLGDENKDLLYEVVFSLDPEDKVAADEALDDRNLWPELDRLLRTVTVVDPACGSGSFLVGMLYVLNDLVARADEQMGRRETPFDRKKRIIARSLYGVDVMEWAVNVAELRLWLQLVIETELQRSELRERAILPNLSFKLRSGDSVVQEVGGMNLGLYKGSRFIPAPLKNRIQGLKDEKRKYYDNDPSCKYRSEGELRKAELKLFRDILDGRRQAIDARLEEIEEGLRPQENLFGEVKSNQRELDQVSLAQERDRLRVEGEKVARAREALQTVKDVPFVWDIAFVEVLEGDRAGFDIAIGNPPYVGRHKIRDPLGPVAPTRKERKAYREKLSRAVYASFPRYFGYSASRSRTARRIGAMCDLYIYFYFAGLSLINDLGSLCYITSNSWLDVRYGRYLQEFLVRRGEVKAIVENRARRSFASAEVNTVIVLLGAPTDGSATRVVNPTHLARFITFTEPYESALSPVIWEEIEEAEEVCTRPEFRVSTVTHRTMLAGGQDPGKSRYVGDQWGGKYLRAPDIYQVMSEAGDWIPAGKIARARLGITTGANDFFFLRRVSSGVCETGVSGETERVPIAERFTRPAIRSVSECKQWTFDESQASYELLLVDSACTDQGVREYIQYAEDLGIHKRPFFGGSPHWYEIDDPPADLIAVPEIVYSRYFFVWNPDRLVLNKNFYGYIPNGIEPDLLFSFLICTYSFLQFELMSRKPGAGASGISVRVANAIQVPRVSGFDADERDELVALGSSIRSRRILDIWEEVKQPDRQNLDRLILTNVGLTLEHGDAMYEALVSLVRNRQGKARSTSKW